MIRKHTQSLFPVEGCCISHDLEFHNFKSSKPKNII